MGIKIQETIFLDYFTSVILRIYPMKIIQHLRQPHPFFFNKQNVAVYSRHSFIRFATRLTMHCILLRSSSFCAQWA